MEKIEYDLNYVIKIFPILGFSDFRDVKLIAIMSTKSRVTGGSGSQSAGIKCAMLSFAYVKQRRESKTLCGCIKNTFEVVDEVDSLGLLELILLNCRKGGNGSTKSL